MLIMVALNKIKLDALPMNFVIFKFQKLYPTKIFEVKSTSMTISANTDITSGVTWTAERVLFETAYNQIFEPIHSHIYNRWMESDSLDPLNSSH